MIKRILAYYKLVKRSRGSALILTLFIMAGMMIVALGDSYIVLLGIKAAGTQAKSTKAYYIAEAGAERLIWALVKKKCTYRSTSLTTSIFTSNSYLACNNVGGLGRPQEVMLDADLPDYSSGLSQAQSGALYQVYYTLASPQVTYKSIGSYVDTKRSVELKFY